MEEDVTDVLEEHLNTIAACARSAPTSYQGVALSWSSSTWASIWTSPPGRARQGGARACRIAVTLEPPVVGSFTRTTRPCSGSRSKATARSSRPARSWRRQVNPYLETIPGVAGVAMFGGATATSASGSMASALRARGLAATDVLGALQRDDWNAGRRGRRAAGSTTPSRPTPSSAPLRRWRRWSSRNTPARRCCCATWPRVEDGAEDISFIARYNGEPTVGMGIRKQSGGNSVAIVDEVRKRLGEVEKVLPSGSRCTTGRASSTSRWRARSGGGDRVRAGFRCTARGLHGVDLPAPLAADLHHRRRHPGFADRDLRAVSLAGFTLNTMTLLAMARRRKAS